MKTFIALASCCRVVAQMGFRSKLHTRCMVWAALRSYSEAKRLDAAARIGLS